jgi:nicotinamidase-related amidase
MRKVKSAPRLFPRLGEFQLGRTALIVIDMQNDFLSPGGKMDRGVGDLDFIRTCVPTVSRLLAAAREAGIKIAHTREGYAPDLSDLPPWRRASEANNDVKVGDSGPLGRALIRGEPGWQIIEEAAPRQDEPVFDKSSYGAFVTTSLDRQLRDWSVDCVILAGVTTDCCVTSTLREALDRGLDCLIVEDAVSSRSREAHETALKLIKQPTGIFGQAAPLQALLDVMESLAAGAAIG